MLPLDIGSFTGLSQKEAEKRLRDEGYNDLPSAERRNIFAIIGEVIREPMFLLLVAAGSIYFILGDVEEGIILLFFVFVIIGITVYQEQKTEKALDALRNLASPRALVIRDGVHARIAGRDVVRGDLMLVSEGDRIAADACLLSSINVSVDESLLTGESVPVRKLPGDDLCKGKPGGDDQPWLYSGTLMVQGQGVAEVVATGIHTEMGRIGIALQSVNREETRLHKETSQIVRRIALIGLLLCAIVVIVYGVSRADWLGGFLAGITLAMAILPEEFPVVLTVFLALGAWRLSRHSVLTRHVPAIETLGSATVLAVDKTGTLTQNRMSVARVNAAGLSHNCDPHKKSFLPEPFHELLEFAILSSKKDPFDPMEKALLQMGCDDLSGTEHLHEDWELMVEYPLSRELLAMSNVWRSKAGDEYIIAAKGAPEAIIDLCHLDVEQKATLKEEIESMAADGLRVIGVAKAYFRKPELPDGQHDFAFSFLGFIGFADPVRPDAASAISVCYDAGIRVVMITGDYPATARHIGREIGLADVEHVITGKELDGMEDLELAEKIPLINIFARVIPEEKLRIVDALKANGDVVAMTGDGVNDAPALKSAHIGIAMGGRGTDVAREASSLVLLDDNFASIVAAVRMGRRIYQNLKKAMAYILSVHVPIAGISILPVLFGWPLILLPVHIVFLELIIDPACSVVFETEREEEDIMKRPPRKTDEMILDRRTVTLALLQGLVVLGFVLVIFLSSGFRGLGENETRTLTFVTIVVANLALICANRSWTQNIVSTLRRPNKAFWWVIGGTLFFLAAILTVPALQAVFKFSPVMPADILICILAGLMSVIWFDLFKLYNARRLVVQG
ncbi:MAG TPA: cation-translocating P-type ATPase [Methanoregulaceae archaeon]|nr:cation-translocating P-type ATPase [Methanoregulaceae archaeon]